MHVVDQVISNFNSSSSFGGIYVFGNQRCNFERLKDCHTDHRNFHDCCIVTITLVKSLCWIWQAYLIQWSATPLQSSTEQRVRKFPFKYLWPAIRSFIKLSNSSFSTDLLIEISSSQASEPSDATLSRLAKLFLCDVGQLLGMFQSSFRWMLFLYCATFFVTCRSLKPNYFCFINHSHSIWNCCCPSS